MPLYKRTQQSELNAENICVALRSATSEQSEGIKSSLNISGFHYSGSGFYFFGDNIQIDNKYLLDGGEDNN
jgi:hypothetical protein